MNTIDEFLQAKEEYQKKVSKIGKATLTEEFKKLFEEVPELESLKWTQYTPHFNDGDACEFGVYDFGGTFSVPIEDEEYEGYDRNTRQNKYSKVTREAGFEFEVIQVQGKDPVMKKTDNALKALRKVANKCDELFESAFGDGVEVTATRKGFKVEDYSHD